MKSPNSKCDQCLLNDCPIDIGSSSCNSLNDIKVLFVTKSPQDKLKLDEEMTETLGHIGFAFTSLVLCNSLVDICETSFELCKPNFDYLMSIVKPSHIVCIDTEVEVEGAIIIKSTIDVSSAIEEILLTYPKLTQTKPYNFHHPQWFFDNDKKLIDIQRFQNVGEVCFIFRDTNNKKHYHSMPDSDYYNYKNYTSFGNSDMITDVSNVELVLGKENRHDKTSGVYDGDVRTEVKHAIDYRFNRTNPEPNINLKIIFFDIEVYNYGNAEYPSIRSASIPINAISFKIGAEATNIWITRLPEMDSKEAKVPEGMNVEYFDSEEDLLLAFAKMIRNEEPDIMCGWNTNGYDWPTIFGRMKKLGISPKRLSPINKAHSNQRRYNDFYIGGIHCLDQLELYKELTYSVEVSYKLEAIAKKELKNKEKVSYTGSLDGLYSDDMTKFLEYSGTDTDILYDLEEALKHINLKQQLVDICSTTWKTSDNTTGLVDPLILAYAKRSNLVCRDAIKIDDPESILGAYVRAPNAGLHEFLVDFDYTSLYPSIACSQNIGPNTLVAKIDTKIAEAYIYKQDDRFPGMIPIEYEPLKENSRKEAISSDEFALWMMKHNYIITISGCIFKSHDEELSFLYKIWRYLLDSRKVYKDKKKEAKRAGNDFEVSLNHNAQLAYKILANSIYGVLAASQFRFFSPDLSGSITATGQESIKYIGFHIGKYMEDVIEQGTEDIEFKYDPYFMDDYDTKEIYGLTYTDTDSVFLQMGDWLIDRDII